jgi:ribose transport system substrate-binding protein
MTRMASFTAAAVAVIAVGGLAACSTSDDSGTDSGSSGGSGAGATDKVPAEVLAYVEDHSTAPTKITPTEPIGQPIPTGKKVVYINCGAQACTNVGTAFEAASKELGWDFVNINSKPTPEGIQAAFTQAINEDPDAVVSGGFGIDSYQRQLAELADKGIPVLSSTGPDEAGGGLTLQIDSPAQQAEAGKLLADKMIVDQNGSGLLGLVTLTGYPTQESLTQSVKDEIEASCPDCSTKTLELAPTAIGTTSAGDIASFLRANPDMKEIYLSYDDLANGLKAATTNAGVDMPKSVSWAPTQTGIAALQTGERTAGVPQFEPELGWQLADTLVRIFLDLPYEDNAKVPPFYLMSKDYDNVPESTDSPASIPDYQDQYKALWGM